MNKKFKKPLLYLTPLAAMTLIVACAQVTSLNLRKHQFGKLPTKIVWIQVAGLSEEHLALLKYSYPTADIKTAFEKSLCVGKAWEYNLYDIRPEPAAGFLSQMTGKKNIKNSCEDYSQRPIWSYMLAKGYKAGVFEGRTGPGQSLLEAAKCGKEDFLQGLRLWKMERNPPKGAEFFHVEETVEFRPQQVYYDRSCLSGDCFSSLSANVEKTFETFSRNTGNYLYILRNFRFLEHLKSGNPSRAKEELAQLDKIVDYFQDIAEKRNDFLLLITSSGARDAEFPTQGNRWEEYERAGKNFAAKKSDLISSVFVNGARAENFCGIYEQSEILSRVFSGAKQQGLELTIINPFKD